MLIAAASLISTAAQALPVDFKGRFGAEYKSISNFAHVDVNGTGTETHISGVTNKKNDLNLDNFFFSLMPTIIVNDAVTIKSEITLFDSRSNYFGQGGHSAIEGHSFPNATKQRTAGNVTVNQAYAEFYSDTSIFKVGRYSMNWGLGALYNDGDEGWSRYSTVRDGITGYFKISNFSFTPFYHKLALGNTTSSDDTTTEYGVGLLYDNVENDIAFGLLYALNSSSNDSQISGTGANNINPDLKLFDIYFKKKFGDLEVEIEAPIYNGKIGDIYSNGGNAKFRGKAIILESSYNLTDTQIVSLKGGHVSGDSASTSDYSALYLNPSYKFSKILFNYNYNTAGNGNTTNSQVTGATNVNYVNLGYTYRASKWDWRVNVMHAIAVETAKKGDNYFRHFNGKRSTAVANEDQETGLGTEIDLGFNYQWNDKITLEGDLAYLLPGKFFEFNNDAASTFELKNTFLIQLRAMVRF